MSARRGVTGGFLGPLLIAGLGLAVLLGAGPLLPAAALFGALALSWAGLRSAAAGPRP